MTFLLFKLLIRKYMYSESKINSKFEFGLTVIRVFFFKCSFHTECSYFRSTDFPAPIYNLKSSFSDGFLVFLILIEKFLFCSGAVEITWLS